MRVAWLVACRYPDCGLSFVRSIVLSQNHPWPVQPGAHPCPTVVQRCGKLVRQQECRASSHVPRERAPTQGSRCCWPCVQLSGRPGGVVGYGCACVCSPKRHCMPAAAQGQGACVVVRFVCHMDQPVCCAPRIGRWKVYSTAPSACFNSVVSQPTLQPARLEAVVLLVLVGMLWWLQKLIVPWMPTPSRQLYGTAHVPITLVVCGACMWTMIRLLRGATLLLARR